MPFLDQFHRLSLAAHPLDQLLVKLRPGEQTILALARACARLWLDSPAAIEEEALRWQRLLRGESTNPSGDLVASAEGGRIQRSVRQLDPGR